MGMESVLRSPAFDLSWESAAGAFNLASPGRSLSGVVGVEVLHKGRPCIITTADAPEPEVTERTLEDVHGVAEEVTFAYHAVQGLALMVQFRFYATRPFVLFRITCTNEGTASVALRRFFFRSLPNSLRPTTAPTGFYRMDWQSWSNAGFLPASARETSSPWYMRRFTSPMMHNASTPWGGRVGRFWSESMGVLATSHELLVAGGASLGDQFVQVRADLRSDNLGLSLHSQGDDVPLSIGEARNSEWFYLEWVSCPATEEVSASTCSAGVWADPLAQYAYAVARQMEVPPLRPAPYSWSSWYIYGDKVAESDVVHNLAAAALLADVLPLQVIQLDQGFEPQWGDWRERNGRFPHSLQWLAERIRGSNFVPGLWLGPFTAHPRSQIATAHPEWLLRNRRGQPVSAGLFAGVFVAQALDTTHPAVEDYLRELIGAAVREWGYDYLKLDFLYAAALPGVRHNPHLTRAQVYRRALRLIREAAGQTTFLVGCGAPLGPSIGLVDAMRIGPDTAPSWEPVFAGLQRPFRKDGSMPALRNSLRNVMTRAWMHGRWWINDPDALMVRETQTTLNAEEIRSQLTLLGLSGGLFGLSDNLSQLTSEQTAVAALLYPPLLEGMDILDLFRRSMPTEVVAPVARPWGHWQLVGLFNWRETASVALLPRHLPGFDPRRKYHLVDFWNRRYQCLDAGAPLPEFALAPHGCVLLGLRPVVEGPQLVGTTFHVSQGGEVLAWRVEPGAVTLRLVLGRIAEGEIWLALPLPPREATLDGVPIPREAISGIARGIWAFKCRLFREGTLSVAW